MCGKIAWLAKLGLVLPTLLLVGCATTKTVWVANTNWSRCKTLREDPDYIAGQSGGHGAIAYGRHQRTHCFSAWGDDLEEVRESALSECRETGSDDCKIIVEDLSPIGPPGEYREITTGGLSADDWASIASVAATGANNYAAQKSGAATYDPNTRQTVYKDKQFQSSPVYSGSQGPDAGLSNAPTKSHAVSTAESAKPWAHAVNGCLHLVAQDTGGISTDSATIRNSCSDEIVFMFCVHWSGGDTCNSNGQGMASVGPGGTTLISVYPANGKFVVRTAECATKSPYALGPAGGTWSGDRFVFSCKD